MSRRRFEKDAAKAERRAEGKLSPKELTRLQEQNPCPPRAKFAIYVADCGRRNVMAATALASARATPLCFHAIPTQDCHNAAEAWDLCQADAVERGYKWWMPLGDDDLVAPFWWDGLQKAFASAEYLLHADATWRITCSGMSLLSEAGWPTAVIEDSPQGFHRTDVVAKMGGYVPHVRSDGSGSDAGLNVAARDAGYGTIVLDGVWYGYRVHSLGHQSAPERRLKRAFEHAAQSGDYLKVWPKLQRDKT